MKHFYSYLVQTELITVELEELDLTPTQKEHLAGLIDSSFYHLVLDISLSHLSDRSDKHIFVRQLAEDSSNSQLMEFLISRGEDIEEKLAKAIEGLRREISQDLQQAKKEKR